jgi:hypothetical protein
MVLCAWNHTHRDVCDFRRMHVKDLEARPLVTQALVAWRVSTLGLATLAGFHVATSTRPRGCSSEHRTDPRDIGWVWHVRMLGTFAALLVLDVIGFAHYSSSVGVKASSVVFGFEVGLAWMLYFVSEFNNLQQLVTAQYMLLVSVYLGILIKYTIHSMDAILVAYSPTATGWEEKPLYIMLTDLVSDFLKLLTYVGFFLVVVYYYGLPLHIIRDIYVTLQSFLQRFTDVQRYLKALEEMRTRYPDATAEDIAATDGVCIICREDLADGLPVPPGSDNFRNPLRPKKLHCGHIFHIRCLKSWLERQQACPTCRTSVLDTPPPAPAVAVPVAGRLGQAPAAVAPAIAIPFPGAAVPPMRDAPPAVGYPGVAGTPAYGAQNAPFAIPGSTLQPANFIVLTPLIPAQLVTADKMMGGLSDAQLRELLDGTGVVSQASSTVLSPEALQAQITALTSVQEQLSQLTATMQRVLDVVSSQQATSQQG